MREKPYAIAGCLVTPRAQKIDLPRIQGNRHHKRGSTSTAFASSDGARGEPRLQAVKRLSTQIVSSTGESNHLERQCNLSCKVVVNACQEYEELLQLATAKLERRCQLLELAHPPVCENTANSLGIHDGRLLKTSASRQEKAAACNRNGAATYEHFGDNAIFNCCARVNTARPEHLNSLLDHDILTAINETVTHKVSNRAA